MIVLQVYRVIPQLTKCPKILLHLPFPVPGSSPGAVQDMTNSPEPGTAACNFRSLTVSGATASVVMATQLFTIIKPPKIESRIERPYMTIL